MCRNIRPLFNFDPPATDEEIRSAAVQYVRKVSGFTKPSQINTVVFDDAVKKVEIATRDLIMSLQASTPKKNREQERVKAKSRYE